MRAAGLEVINRMNTMPGDDDAFGAGTIRRDGRKLCPSYPFEVKAPAESRSLRDCHKLWQTTPAAKAFRPLNQGGCSLVRS